MATFKYTNINRSGFNLVFVLVNSAFDSLPDHEKTNTIDYLQQCANSSGVFGTIIPIWVTTTNQIGILVPPNLQFAIQGIDLTSIIQNMSGQLICN